MKVKLFWNGTMRYPWTLQYGRHGDSRCSYSTWQQAIWDLPHAVACTFSSSEAPK